MSNYGVIKNPWLYSIERIEQHVHHWPENAQHILENEYKRPGGPRYSLIQWLKRHRLHNPTVRVIHKP